MNISMSENISARQRNYRIPLRSDIGVLSFSNIKSSLKKSLSFTDVQYCTL